MSADPVTAPIGITADARWPGLLAGEQLRLNLSEEFALLAERRPEAPLSIHALHHGASAAHTYEVLTYGHCRILMDRYARLMYADGLRHGDTALVLLKPTLDFFPVLLAMLKLGLVPVALEPGMPRDEKLAAIERVAPRVLVAAPSARILRAVRARAFRSIRHVVTVGESWWPGETTLAATRTPGSAGPAPTARTTTHDPMFIGFTTGSTGPAKGVVFTQANGVAIIEGMRDALDLRPGDICLSCHPAFSLYFAGAGASVVTPDLDPRYPQSADPACVLAIIRDRRPVTAFMQLPILHALWRHCAARGEKIPYLTRVLTTGATVPLNLVEGLHSVLAESDADLHVMYGATEALCVSFTTGREMLRRADTVRAGGGTYLGKPAPFVRVGVIAVTGNAIERWSDALTLAPGRIGEICVQGPAVTPAYYRAPQATRAAKIAGSGGLWHRTGDAGYLDAEGGLWYCGRLTGTVQTDAGPLYSDLVEPLFNAHPAVRRSALIGVERPETHAASPVVLVEPHAGAVRNASDATHLRDELRALARAHRTTRSIDDIRIYRGVFPVDVRHGAKIRRDLLAAEATGPEPASQRFPASQSIAFGDYRIAYYDHGVGEPILFLHNAGNDHYIWERQIERLSQEYRVVAADSLGYGCSDHPRVAYTLHLYTEMVSALVDQLNLAPVTIIGSCTGASMALNYALRCPERVKRLILFHIATPHTVRGGGFEPIVNLVNRRPRRTQALLVPGVRALMTHGLLHRGMISSQYGRQMADDAAFTQHLHGLYSQPHQAASMLSLFSQWDSFAPLDEVGYPPTFPPLHLLWGAENRLLPLARGRTLSETLRPQSFDVIAGGGHLVMRERSEVVTRRILQLLR